MIYLSHFFILFNYHLHYVYYKCKKKEEVNSNFQFPSELYDFTESSLFV